MKHFGLILSLFLICLFSGSCLSLAADGSNVPLKIGVVDYQKIMRTAKATKSAQEVFEKELQTAKDTLAAKEKEVQAMEEDLKKQSPKLPVKKRKEKEEEIAKAASDLKRLDSEKGEEFRQKAAEINQKILGEIQEVVDQIRQQEQYTLILEKNTLVSYDQAIDITDKAIQFYDTKKK